MRALMSPAELKGTKTMTRIDPKVLVAWLREGEHPKAITAKGMRTLCKEAANMIEHLLQEIAEMKAKLEDDS
jgi:hypothetical protein